MTTSRLHNKYVLILISFVAWFSLFTTPLLVEAATLSVAPATGVYTLGSTFTVQALINTTGQPVNAAEATISFNPKELAVVAITKGSTFNLWTAEPSFSNTTGTIIFSGGTPTGYTGSGANVLSITFRSLTAATARVAISGGSVLAADGRGTNVLTTMTGGAYTISAATVKPNPEVIIEYVPPANTPAAPRIESATHKADGWSKDRTARLTWSLPSDVTAVRTAWDNNASTIPTKVYNPPIKELTLPDLTDGVSFFHLQFQNKDGWGKVAHYRLAVDTGLPDTLALALPLNANLTTPLQVLYVQGTSTIGAPLVKYVLQLNGGDAIELEAPDAPVGIIQLPPLNPGYQTVIIEVFDAAGNSRILTQSFTIEAFAAPVFTDYPAELTPGIIPVIKGTTRPASTVTLTINLGAMESRIYTVQSDSAGVFTFVPEGSLAQGVYTITAVAKDSMDAISLTSAAIKIAVQPSGIIRIGNMLLSVLTIVVSLLATVLALILLSLYTLRRFRRFQTMLKKEAAEVTSSIDTQFHHILLVLAEAEEKLRQSRKSQTLTQSEQSLVTEVRQAVETALHTIEKEADDVTMVVERSK